MKAGWLTVLGVVFGCTSSSPDSRPPAMSAVQHEEAAQEEERAVVEWTSVTNPTDANRRAIEEHRRRAADHRAASGALRDAEARACVGISPEDRDGSPFEHTEDIESVAPLKEWRRQNRRSYEELVGATVTFRAVRGMTAEWLQRVVDCHLARNASLGHVVPEMPNCPLVPEGASAMVSSTGRGFAVAIRSNDPAVAKEILGRAERLAPPPAGGQSRR